MSTLTIEYLESLGLGDDEINAIIQKQSQKAPPRTHFKHWIYLKPEQAQEVAQRYQDDPDFRMVKYSHVRKSRKEGKPLNRIDI